MMRVHITFPIILIGLFIIIGNSYAQTPVDTQPPTVTNYSPLLNSIQVPLNNLISFNIADDGEGVDADSVEIKVNGNTVYTGNTNQYTSQYGNCQRLGKKHDYTFIYQSNETFDYDQTVIITITAKDFAGNVLKEYSYYIMTEMRSFGQNKKVNSGLDNLNCNSPVTVCDSSGNIWVAWHAGPIGNRDIYVGKLAAGAEEFGSSVRLTDEATDQCNPAIALDSTNKLYVVWQDNRQGDWDIYVSTSIDGISWSPETMANDPNDNHQVNPAIVIDGQSPDQQAQVVWQEDHITNQDIYIAASSTGFATKTVSRITSDSFDQVEPAVAADSSNTIYVVWTDGRNSSTDIYGAASNNAWANVTVVNDPNNQSSPVIAAESIGTILHLLWVDDTDPNGSIFYASTTNGLQGPLDVNTDVVDERAYKQAEPTIAVTGSTGNNLKVFACWQDWRNVNTTNPNDMDIYFTELISGFGTNIFVGDEGTNSYQGEPAIGVCKLGFPYLVWTDGRNTNTDIYYAGSTFVEPIPLWSELVSYKNPKNAIYGVPEGHLRNPGDISIKVPPRAFPCDTWVNASRIRNTQRFGTRESVDQFEFGPSGIQFGVPITITIAYEPLGAPVEVYWYDPNTDALRQDGITNVTHIEKPTVDLVRFKTRHFTPFYLFEGSAAAGGGGGGGGCSMSPYGQGSVIEFLLPYTAIVIALLAIRRMDARRKKC